MDEMPGMWEKAVIEGGQTDDRDHTTQKWLDWEEEWKAKPNRPKLALPRAGELAMTTDHPPLLPPDSPLWDAIVPAPLPFKTFRRLQVPILIPEVAVADPLCDDCPKRTDCMDPVREVCCLNLPGGGTTTITLDVDGVSPDTIAILTTGHTQYCRDDWEMYHGDGPRGMGPNDDGCVCALTTEAEPEAPKLWDKRPEMVTHIAGTALTVFGIFLRQRCDWCGIVLFEYDLRRVAVPIGQPGAPGSWTPGALIRIDGNMSAEIANPAEQGGEVQLPMDSCCFDPETQIK